MDLASNIEHIVQKAKKSLDNEKVEMSNNQKVKGIRGIVRWKEARRKEEAFLMADAIPIHQEVEKEEKVEEVSSETVVSKMDLLRQKQKEKLKYAINNK